MDKNWASMVDKEFAEAFDQYKDWEKGYLFALGLCEAHRQQPNGYDKNKADYALLKYKEFCLKIDEHIKAKANRLEEVVS